MRVDPVAEPGRAQLEQAHVDLTEPQVGDRVNRQIRPGTRIEQRAAIERVTGLAALPQRKEVGGRNCPHRLLAGWLREGWFGWLDDVDVALPAFILELDMLDRNRAGVRVKIRQRLKLRYPAAIHLVSERELTGLVVDLDDDVLAEVLQ